MKIKRNYIIIIIIIYFPGANMEELAKKLLDVKKCEFEPCHKNNLANEFCCYANYDTDIDTN